MSILSLTLDDNGSVPIGVVTIPSPGHILEVILPIGNPFHSPHACLLTNHPNSDGEENQIIKPTKPYAILEDLTFHIQIRLPGAWEFHLENAEPVRFIVDPIIYIKGEAIPPSGLNIQTDFGRCIGHVEDWLENLRPISKLGYNMIHLPPFQEIGGWSHYSVYDHLMVSKYLYPDGFPEKDRWSVLKTEFKKIEKELGIVFMADIIMNHMNPNCPWLKNHTDAGFNLDNSPHLKPAFYVDQLLNQLSNKIAKGEVENIPSDLKPEHVENLRNFLMNGIRDSELKNFYVIDVEQSVNDLIEAIKKPLPKKLEMLRVRAVNYSAPHKLNILRNRGILKDDKTKYQCVRINPRLAAALYVPLGQIDDEILDEFREALNTINAPFYQHYDSIVNEVVQNVTNTFQWSRYDPNGPKYGNVTIEFPLVWQYFSIIKTDEGREVPLANNGWVFGSNPTDDFIAPGKECYVRRQVVIWGDNIKINYGDKYEDNPELWDYMAEYVATTAEVVHSIRLDNCHSTKIQVAEYFIKKARKVNPNLYIMAELFTGSEEEDIRYINHIGINAFMREGQNNKTADEMAKLIWNAGGRHVAQLDGLNMDSVIRPLRQIPGIIFDLTHDNFVPSSNRLTLSTVYSMTCSPFGSTRGYDEFLDFNPSVSDCRKYPISNEGLHPVREILNKIHTQMAVDGMNEILIKPEGNLITIFRCNSTTGEGIWTIVRLDGDCSVNEIEIPTPIDSLVVEARILDQSFVPSNGDITDTSLKMNAGKCELFFNDNDKKMKSVKIEDDKLLLVDFPSGSIAIFRTKLNKEMTSDLKQFECKSLTNTFKECFKEAGVTELAMLMYHCSAEEQETFNHGSYAFPNGGEAFYAGTQGIETALDNACNSPEGMDHPIILNIRQGDWLIEYLLNRFNEINQYVPIASVFIEMVEKLRNLPRYLIPKYLDRIIHSINQAASARIAEQLSDLIKDSDSFWKSLAAVSTSFFTPVTNSYLVNPARAKIFEGLVSQTDISVAAGLPHFSTGFMRSWGRDTFIALRGLFLVTGRFKEAKDILIVFAACLRHGLIPNLHDGCMNPRYNSRDATWFFLQALQDYYLMSDDKTIFKWKVPRLFPTDDQADFEANWMDKEERPVTTMEEIVQEIMTKHANGIKFREWNAGEKIDSVMTDEGFNVSIVTDFSNGFILGGNEHNCGTWMDKMGSSEKANNKGHPATPRDGADIEIIGLLQSTLRFLDIVHKDGLYKYDGVTVQATEKTITWRKWSNLLKNNFETWFYIPSNPKKDQAYFVEHSKTHQIIGIRGIYKDTVGSTIEFGDYQFRPNLLIAMTVAPELFDPVHANKCLDLVEERLMGHIGMKTLDPSDFRYRPYYTNEENEDYLTSSGFNYHNGPEWLWPTGYFFRASLAFNRGITKRMRYMLANIKRTKLESWASGLPELTNKDGEFCAASCQNQAWSVSAMLEIFNDGTGYVESMQSIDKFDDESEEDESDSTD